MATHGGRRTPANPAPVSGPGQLSRRTDGGSAQPLRDVTGLPYGENQDLNQEQAAAPLAQTPSVPSSGATGGTSAGSGVPQVVPFNAPTQRPDEPVTQGSPMGPGAGPEVLNLQGDANNGYQTALSTLQSVVASSGSPEAQALLGAMGRAN